MGSKKKSASIFIKLVSTAGTGFFYVTKKNPRKTPDKLEFRKYDPRVNCHVLFTESKMRMGMQIWQNNLQKREESEMSIDSNPDSYKEWLAKHPSALTSFNKMVKDDQGRRMVVFLDYDGTLSPIVDDPDCAFMSTEMRSAVREVANVFPTAIISGRKRDKVYEFVQLTEVYYAGSHGMDIMGPPTSYDRKYQTKAFDNDGNEVVIFQPAQDFLPTVKKIINLLEENTKKIGGVVIEDNKFCISVHFRNVLEQEYEILEEKLNSLIKIHTDFCIMRGKKVFEIRPIIKWNKGYALEYLIENMGFGSSSEMIPVYIGDDQTDEDAFKVINKRGKGYGIVVSSTPKETRAGYSLEDPSEVLKFLSHLARWKKECK